MAVMARGFGRFGRVSEAFESWFATGALAALVAVPVLGTLAALAFLIFGILLMSTRPRDALATLLSRPALMLLPIFCTLSVLWSLTPALSFRFGLQLTATFAIAIVLATRLPLRASFTTIFAMLFAIITLGIVAGTFRSDTGALIGHYGSKNAMAGAAALFTLVSVGLAATSGGHRGLRLAAAIGVAIGMVATLLAQSVSALAYLPIGVGAFFAILALRRASTPARFVISAFLILSIVLAGILFAAYSDAIAAAFFDATGKDVTLTGRTDLWRIALDLIAERPLLGVGYQAFWVQGHAPAEALWMMFGIETRSGFNFHNTYLSNAVEIGLIGVAIESVLMAAAVLLSARFAIRTGKPDAALLFALSVMLLVVTPIEAPVFFQFNLQSVLVVMTLVYASDGLRRPRTPA